MSFALSLLVVAATVYFMVRRFEVRLVLLGAGLVLGLIAGRPLLLFDTFTRAMVAGMVGPICAAMGFAAVVSATGCDKHLVHLLLMPIRKVRLLMLPGGILVAYLVNMAVSSQTSTAAAIGPILVPLLLAAGFSKEVAGAALLLGASFGGDLLNPGAQDVVAIASVANIAAPALSSRVIPASLAGAITAALVFAFLNRRREEAVEPSADVATEEFRVSLLHASVPVAPIAMLLLAYGGVPALAFLIATPPGDDWKPFAGSLPIVRAMLIGVVFALIVARRDIQRLTRTMFTGIGEAYGTIISLTITAQCFGAGVAAVGLSAKLLELARAFGFLALLAAGFPWALSLLSGSGSGPILTFAQTFLPGLGPGDDSVRLAALACFGGDFGRTMSPVAAVVVYCSGLVAISPIALVRRLAPAIAAGAIVSFGLAWL
ncbi:MAG: C4-dicarboxylate transporter DcuC [Vicinamibacteria bacterium]